MSELLILLALLLISLRLLRYKAVLVFLAFFLGAYLSITVPAVTTVTIKLSSYLVSDERLNKTKEIIIQNINVLLKTSLNTNEADSVDYVHVVIETDT